jgi:hypothetical protein
MYAIARATRAVRFTDDFFVGAGEEERGKERPPYQ